MICVDNTNSAIPETFKLVVFITHVWNHVRFLGRAVTLLPVVLNVLE